MTTTKNNYTKKRKRNQKSIISDEMVKSPFFWGILIILLIIYFVFFRNSDENRSRKKIDSTPDCITAIKEISEWEFLTLQLEELIDTTITKKLSSNQSVKIYVGTARLGIIPQKANKAWIECKDDKATITLPAIELLDKDIIDDTQTRTFYENGNISATVKDKMYQDAKKRMKNTALKKENIKIAEENAKETFQKLFYALGYKTIKVTFKK